jgi:hypothetical protein
MRLLPHRAHDHLRRAAGFWAPGDLAPHNANAVDGVAVLVIVCFLIGIGRSWELIGGPSIVLRSELSTILRGERSEDDAPDARP